MNQIVIVAKLENGEIKGRPWIDGTNVELPAWANSPQIAACYLLHHGLADASTLINWRNDGSEHVSFKPFPISRAVRASGLRADAIDATPEEIAARRCHLYEARQPIPQKARAKSSACRAVWDALDSLGDNEAAKASCEAAGVYARTFSVQRSYWRKAQKLRAMRKA